MLEGMQGLGDIAGQTYSIPVHAGIRWAAPRMQRPQRLLADLCSSAEAQEFLTIPAHCSGHQDLSSLVELQLIGADGTIECAMALEGLLRQARGNSWQLQHLLT